MSTVTFDILARDRASATFRQVGNETQTLTHRLDGLRSMARRVVTAIGLFEVGRELTNFANQSVHAYAAAATAETKLTDAFQRFPALANVQIQALDRLNMALERRTGTDHSALAAGEATLAQFNLTGRAIKALVPYLNDYAAKTGQDIPSAATGLGRALLGNSRALKSVGIEFKATGNQANDAARLTQLLRDKVGGFAAKEGSTAAGQAKILSAAFRDAKESLGRALLPSLLHVAEFLNRTAIPALRSLVDTIHQRVLPAVEGWGRSVSARLSPALRQVWGWIRGSLLPALKSLGEFIIRDVVPAVVRFERAIIGGLVNAFHSVQGAISAHRSGLTTIFDAFKVIVGFIIRDVVPVFGKVLKYQLETTGRTIAAVVTAVGYLGDGFRALAHFLTGPFVRGVGTMVSYFIRGVKYLADVWFGVVGKIVDGGAKAFGWLPVVGDDINNAAKAFDSFRTSVDSTLSGIASDAAGFGAAAGNNWGTNFAASVNPYLDPGHPGYKGPKAKPVVTAPVTTGFSYNPTALATTTGSGLGKAAAASVHSAFDAAKQRMAQDLASIKSQFAQERQSLVSGVALNLNATTDSFGDQGPTRSFSSQLRSNARQMEIFANLYLRLAHLGASPGLLAQIEPLGVAAIPAMRQLVHEGRRAIRRDNRAVAAENAAAGRVAAHDTLTSDGALIHRDLTHLPHKLAVEFAHSLSTIGINVSVDGHHHRKVRAKKK